MYAGSCLCGGIRFRIESELAPIELCHCQQCRKAQGAAFAANSPIRSEAFVLVSGEDLLARAFLHEIDHLKGTLYISHISPLKRDLIRRKIRKLQKANEWG